MRAKRGTGIAFMIAVMVWAAVPANAQQQQITVSTPSYGVSDSFFESVGNGRFMLAADQGSTRSMNMVAPSLTVTNGVPGFISATTQRPFVIGLVPVVGDYGGSAAPVYGPAPLMQRYTLVPSVVRRRADQLKREGVRPPSRGQAAGSAARGAENGDAARSRLAAARDSSAGRAVESVAAIRQRQAQTDEAREREIAELRRKMNEAQAAGKPQVARIYQQQLARRTGGSAPKVRSANSSESK